MVCCGAAGATGAGTGAGTGACTGAGTGGALLGSAMHWSGRFLFSSGWGRYIHLSLSGSGIGGDQQSQADSSVSLSGMGVPPLGGSQIQ
jgi:hypothetical protein